MAKTALQIATGITGISCGLSIFTTWGLAWHVLRLYGAKGILGTLFQVDTYLLRAHVSAPGGVCSVVKKILRYDLCGIVTGAKDLQGLASGFCTPVVKIGFPSLCSGYSAAHLGGVAVFLSIVLMLGFFGTATWLMHRYMNEPKKKYREIAFILQSSGTVVHTGAILFYSIFVMMELEGVHAGNAAIDMAVSPDQSIGVTWGCWISWVCFILNVVALILFANSKLKEEARYLEMKRQKEFEDEQNRNAPPLQAQPAQYADAYGYGAGSGYAAPSAPAYDSSAYGAGCAGSGAVNYSVQIDIGAGGSAPGMMPPGMAPGMMPSGGGSDFGIASGPHPA